MMSHTIRQKRMRLLALASVERLEAGLSAVTRALVGAGLRKALEGVLDAPLRIDALTLFKQENRNRPFSAVARLPFANVQTAREKA